MQIIYTIIVATMYVDSCRTQRGNKTYIRHLLRESYRERGKVKHRTLTNISHCKDEEIEAIKLALRYKGRLEQIGTVKDVKTRQGMRVGAVFSLNAIAERVGLPKVLGSHRQGKLALWQVLARLIDQGSRFSAVRLAERHSACDLLGLDAFCEDDLYRNLAWMADNQEKIEKRLFKKRYSKASAPDLFLYDVTSSYLEGIQNALADWGHNRDGKNGKRQIVIGLLCDPDGDPICVRVFKGNTSDTTTVAEQIRTLAHEFGARRVTLVGDRGMIKGPQIEELDEAKFNYITAISKSEIRTLLSKGTLQMTLFDEEITEVEDETEGIRYILRRNPVRQSEMRENRRERITKVVAFAQNRTDYLAESERRSPEVALRKIKEKITRYKLDKILRPQLNGRKVEVKIDSVALAEAELLDGCYVIKTDLPKDRIDARSTHDRYKDLSKVEGAFRTFKNGHLEIRPIFVRSEKSTRGHVFVVMLAYFLERKLHELWRHLECTVPEGIDELGSIRGAVIQIGSVYCQKVPQLEGLSKQLLDAANIRLPEVLPLRKVHVATRKKLVDQRT